MELAPKEISSPLELDRSGQPFLETPQAMIDHLEVEHWWTLFHQQHPFLPLTYAVQEGFTRLQGFMSPAYALQISSTFYAKFNSEIPDYLDAHALIAYLEFHLMDHYSAVAEFQPVQPPELLPLQMKDYAFLYAMTLRGKNLYSDEAQDQFNRHVDHLHSVLQDFKLPPELAPLRSSLEQKIEDSEQVFQLTYDNSLDPSFFKSHVFNWISRLYLLHRHDCADFDSFQSLVVSSFLPSFQGLLGYHKKTASSTPTNDSPNLIVRYTTQQGRRYRTLMEPSENLHFFKEETPSPEILLDQFTQAFWLKRKKLLQISR